MTVDSHGRWKLRGASTYDGAMVVGSKPGARVLPWLSFWGASFVLACGSSREEGDPADTRGGSGGADVTAGQAGTGAGGTGAAGMGGNGNSAGTNAGGESTAGADSGAGGENSAGAAASAGQGAAGSSSGGSGIPAVGDGELDATCMQRTSLHTPGSRIVELVAVTAEGDRAFLSFYDTEKQEECLPAQDADGTFRCLPPARDKDLVNIYYLDDQCTQEAHYRGICSLDYQAIPVSSDGCDQRRRLVPFGERLADQLVYELTPEGACEPYNELNNLYAAGPELVPSEYVELEPVAFRGLGRIWTRGFQGDGDLRIVTDLLDSELDQRCGVLPLEDGQEHCAPVTRGQLGFTDPSCEQSLLYADSTCGEPPAKYVAYGSGDSCNPSASFLRATAPYEGELYLSSSCMPATNMDATTFSTEPAPASDFVAFESATATSDEGRLKPMYRTTLDGGCFFQDFWDEELETVCTFTGSGSTFYCLPKSSSPGESLELYADSSCDTAQYYVRVRNCDGAKPPPFWVVYSSACGSGFELRALDPKPRTVRRVDPAPVTLPSLWVGSGDSCTPYTPDSQYTHYAAGDVVPTSAFMPATLEP